jgi:acyl carrier protein
MTILQRVIAIVSEETNTSIEKLNANTSFSDLGLDSLEFMALIVALREMGDIPDEKIGGLNTIADVVSVLD